MYKNPAKTGSIYFFIFFLFLQSFGLGYKMYKLLFSFGKETTVCTLIGLRSIQSLGSQATNTKSAKCFFRVQ